MLAALAASLYVEVRHPSFIGWIQDDGALAAIHYL